MENNSKLIIGIERWKALYKDNNKMIDYIRSLQLKKIILIGKNATYLSEQISIYGNDFDVEVIDSNVEVSKSDDRVMILDCDSESNDPNIVTLNELCRKTELYYFVNSFSKQPDINVSVFEIPAISNLENITEEEMKRIEFDHHYRYYYDRYKDNEDIRNLLINVLGNLFSDEFILSRNYMPNVYLRGGVCFLEDSNNPYCSSINGLRTTTDQIRDYAFNLNLFGPCTIFGALVDDKNTIASALQRKVNDDGLDYQVNNYGARAIEFSESIRTADNIVIKKGDQFIFLIAPSEKAELERMGYKSVKSLLPVFNDKNLKNYFIDEPVHCNQEANTQLAGLIFKELEKQLLVTNPSNKENAQIINIPKRKNIFQDNKLLDEYLSFLSQYQSGDNEKIGCILMNCNPFTYGHYNLINYASNRVDKLFVFVVQEDKSQFSFEDRFEMVKLNCEDFSNVTVLPGGKIFTSSVLFPEYFVKEDNPSISIDVSLHREVFTHHIAPLLNITIRFVGEENFDNITRAYNEDMKKFLPLYGIEVCEIPRFKDDNNNEISAKIVRNALNNNDWDLVQKLVPPATFAYLSNKHSCETPMTPMTLKKEMK